MTRVCSGAENRQDQRLQPGEINGDQPKKSTLSIDGILLIASEEVHTEELANALLKMLEDE